MEELLTTVLVASVPIIIRWIIAEVKRSRYAKSLGVLIDVIEDELVQGHLNSSRTSYMKDAIKEKSRIRGVGKFLHSEVKKRTP